MTRVNAVWLLLGVAFFSAASSLRGQEEAVEPQSPGTAETSDVPAGEGEQLSAIRQLLEQQSRQLEAIARQISKLSQTADFQKAHADAGSLTAEAQNTTAPAAASPATPAATGTGPEVPRAEAVNPTIKHVVAKGETLTSIAKHYNITVADLLKLNKIENDRKLQIGHTVNVPSKADAPQTATPIEKKENP